MKPTIPLLFFIGITLNLVACENYIIDDNVDTSSLEIRVEHLSRNRRLSDTSNLGTPASSNATEAVPPLPDTATEQTPAVNTTTSNTTTTAEDSEKTPDSGPNPSDLDDATPVADDATEEDADSKDTAGDDAASGDAAASGAGGDSAAEGGGSSDNDKSSEEYKALDDIMKEYCDNDNNTCKYDHHKYYKLTYVEGDSLWKELNPEENPAYPSTRHVNLSTSEPKRGYKLQPGDFNLTNFLFYGQAPESMTILTGGFLHVGDIVSAKIVSIAQYIAPFMGNFHPNAHAASNIYYYSDENIFIVQWDKMQIANKSEMGNFTFQLQLHKNSDIVFAYKEVPTAELSAEDHENAIGLSDAFHIVSPSHLMIHVYHTLDANKTEIKNGSAIRFQALPSCTTITDCYNCTTANLPDFECRWCSQAGICSDKHGDGRHAKWWRQCQLNYKEKGQMCDEYCYVPSNSDYTNQTTYTPAPTLPVIPANSNGSSQLRVDCNDNYSVSVRYNITFGDVFSCTTGGVELPTCKKSCKYTTAPTNGQLQGLTPGHSLKPDASKTVTCNLGHRLRNEIAERKVTCIDNGVLEPDPANIKCEKYCNIPHAHNAQYNPAPVDSGYLHEGEKIVMTCNENYAFDAFLKGTQLNNTLELECGENSNFTNLREVCVGYCTVAQHPNTSYNPQIAQIGQKISISCSNNTELQATDKKEFTCQRPGPLKLPACQLSSHIQADETVSTTTHSLTILLIIFILCIVCIVGGWVLYAYRNPTSPSGLFLIEKCRPWTWRSHTYSRHQESLAESYYMDGGI